MGEILAVGTTGDPANDPFFASSTDGIDWTVNPLPDSVYGGVAANDDRTIVVGFAGKVLVSYDRVVWLSGNSGTTGYIDNIATDGDLFVAAADQLIESTDGLTWNVADGDLGDPVTVDLQRAAFLGQNIQRCVPPRRRRYLESNHRSDSVLTNE